MSWLVEAWDLMKMPVILWTKNSRLKHRRKKNAIEAPFVRGYKEKCKIPFRKCLVMPLKKCARYEQQYTEPSRISVTDYLTNYPLLHGHLLYHRSNQPASTNRTLMSWGSRKVGSCEQCYPLLDDRTFYCSFVL